MASDHKFPMILAALLLSLTLAVLMPLLFANLMAVSLMKLRLNPQTALILVVAMMFGGLINIPVYRIAHTELVMEHPLAAFGLMDFWPTLRRVRRQTIVAVNIGGCIIPTCLAIYEVFRLSEAGSPAIAAVCIAAAINVAVCYFAAKPVPNVGILMPAFVPAATAAGSAYLLFPRLAPPVAFVAGVMGPIIGADLMHIKEFTRTTTGVASIGGAGTFDGIILSGILAAYLA
jgi:uncharacterized membrane protein